MAPKYLSGNLALPATTALSGAGDQSLETRVGQIYVGQGNQETLFRYYYEIAPAPKCLTTLWGVTATGRQVMDQR